MSAPLGRCISKIPPDAAPRFLKTSSPRLFVLSRFIVRTGNDMVRPFSIVTTIPIVGYEYRSDIPSERSLSRLNTSGFWRGASTTQTLEQKQDIGLSAQEAQRRKREKAQKTNQEDTANGIYLVDDNGVGGGTSEDKDQHGDNSRDNADTLASTDAPLPDYSNEDSGGCDGGDCGSGLSGGNRDGGW